MQLRLLGFVGWRGGVASGGGMGQFGNSSRVAIAPFVWCLCLSVEDIRWEGTSCARGLVGSSRLVPTGDEIRDDYDRIEIDTGIIATTGPTAQTLRKPIGTFKGRQTHDS